MIAMRGWLKRKIEALTKTGNEPVGLGGLSYDELAEIYRAKGWPPPSKSGPTKVV